MILPRPPFVLNSIAFLKMGNSVLQVGVDAFKVGKTYPFYRRYTAEPYAPIAAAIRGETDVRAALSEAERLTNQVLQS